MGVKVDYSGKRFGMLVVISEARERTLSGALKWLVRCDCGNEKEIRIQGSRAAQSCGCERGKAVSKAAKKDIKGIRFGRLLVLSEVKKRPLGGAILWECLCDCGNLSYPRGGSLRSGQTTSCGCFRKEQSISAVTTHGMSGTSIYKRWEQIIQRCTNPGDAGYGNYGGRGIEVCTAWLRFGVFYRDMGPVPFFGATIDRINNDSGYCKENCEWTKYDTQGANRRTRNKTGFKGVSAYDGGFRYRIKKDGTTRSKCRFRTAKEASIACEAIRSDIYGRTANN